MRKIILVIIVLVAFTQVTYAQLDFGVKAGANYNFESFIDVKDDVLSGSKGKMGFHAGLWTRVKIPAADLYVRPELIYTFLSNEVTFDDDVDSKADYNFQTIDIPILLGKKFLKVVHAFVGPSFQYIITSDLKLEDAVDEITSLTTDVSGFTVGFQAGAGLEFGKFGVDVRWERAFSDVASNLIQDNVDTDIEFDTRINQIVVGFSLQF